MTLSLLVKGNPSCGIQRAIRGLFYRARNLSEPVKSGDTCPARFCCLPHQPCRALGSSSGLVQCRNFSGSKFEPYPIKPYRVRTNTKLREARKAVKRAAVKARKAEEQGGVLCNPLKTFRFEIKRNTGIGWTRSLQVCKHLEMHQQGKGPLVDSEFRTKLKKIVKAVKYKDIA